ncbi:hypothetical protein GIB67_008952 [Kingdonia uniflora]|uniref:Uncharacterized protein n=1 Tax=Kingdonia uniflora TaxID=39325 RepID=A0A7J7LVJ8_9MAGN|nr:hypothetical protein GIB67_008952 [Kingdonia uniflora]
MDVEIGVETKVVEAEKVEPYCRRRKRIVTTNHGDAQHPVPSRPVRCDRSRLRRRLSVLEVIVFARLYPLDQKDLAPALRPIDFGVPIPTGVEVETSARDYTPPQYLTLLFTDLGVLTPSAVSDELIQLYL